MKPIFRDNMCMGNIKEELFFETLFLVGLIKKQLLIFTVQLGSITQCSITNFNCLLSHSRPYFTSTNIFTPYFQIKHSSAFNSTMHPHITMHPPGGKAWP
jgi:hypothetical protein